MTQHEFSHILECLPTLSHEQLKMLRRKLEAVVTHASQDPQPPADTDEERADQELQRRLYEAGLLSEIKPPVRDMTPYRDRRAIPITGEPLSETVIRERR
jgi:hypothetical protein